MADGHTHADGPADGESGGSATTSGGGWRRRPWWVLATRVRLVAFLAIVVLVAAVAIVVFWGRRLPSEQDLREAAGLVGRRELLVGVKDDQPGVGYMDPKTHVYTGFDIDIVYMVAADLGFRRNEVRLLNIEAEDRDRMQARDSDGQFVQVDLVVASYSITKDREGLTDVTFSAPYLRTELSVLTRRDHPPVSSLTDLAGKKACTITTSTSTQPSVDAGVKLFGKNGAGQCVDGLLGGQYDAVILDAAILAGFEAQHPDQLMLHDIGDSETEAYGINTGGNEPLRKLVDLSLYRSRNDPDDHRWEDAFDRDLRSEQPASKAQPVAIDQQPEVPKVKVRQWPWERLLGGH